MNTLNSTAGHMPMHSESKSLSARFLGDTLSHLGIISVFGAIALIYVWFGGMKFTAYEAEGISGLVSNSPLLSWVYEIFSTRTFSTLLGLAEVSIGLLIAGRLISPKLSAVGGLLASALFLGTLTFMFTTPGVVEPSLGGFPALSIMPGQFLLKDIGLFAASLFIAGHSFRAIAEQNGE